MISVKLYLKNRSRPVKITFETEKAYNEYLKQLHDDDIIDIGAFVFSKRDFRYQTVMYKKV